MEDIVINIGKQQLRLMDDYDSLKKYANIQFSTISADENGKVTIIELPISAYSSIGFRGKKFKTVEEIYKEFEKDGITPNDHVFCCGEDDDIRVLRDIQLDFNYCPFGSESSFECCGICHNVSIFRGKEITGFDMANVVYNHGLQCTVIAVPGYAWEVYNGKEE